MKRYNKSEIMKSAWRLFKMRIFKSFAEALKNAWSIEIDKVKRQERINSFCDKMDVKSAPKKSYSFGVDLSSTYNNAKYCGNGRYVGD